MGVDRHQDGDRRQQGEDTCTAYTKKDGRGAGVVAGAMHGNGRAGAGQAADAVLGRLGPGQRAGRAVARTSPAKTGIDDEVRVRAVDRTIADRFLNELNSKGKLCDLIIGDSQWIGGAAENGHYVKLNDFFDKEGIKMDDFVPATVVGYSEWPKNTPNYWALPAMGDAVGWTYRKDWFARPELQAEFKEKYGRDLAPPKTCDELKQIAEFFQGREIDGKKVYGAYDLSPSAAPKASRWA